MLVDTVKVSVQCEHGSGRIQGRSHSTGTMSHYGAALRSVNRRQGGYRRVIEEGYKGANTSVTVCARPRQPQEAETASDCAPLGGGVALDWPVSPA